MDENEPRRRGWLRAGVGLAAQLAGGAAALVGVTMLFGAAVALLVGGLATLALGVLHEAGRL